MSKSLWLGTTLLSVLASGCGSDAQFSYDGLPVFSAGDRRELHRSDALALPLGSAVVGDLLIVVDVASDSAIHVLNRFDGRLLASYGRKGEGPGEFMAAPTVDPDRAANSVWVFDADLSRITYVNLGQLLTHPDSVVPRMINLRAEGPLEAPLWTSQGSILSPGHFASRRLIQLDSNGTQTGFVGPPLAGDPLIDAVVRQQIHQATSATNPSRDRLVVVSRWVPRIEIFDPEGTLLTLAQAPFEWDITPDNIYSLTVWAVTKDMPYGYVSVAASKRWVFALFSGRTRRSHPENTGFGEVVHVFDWSGRFVGYIPLAAEALTISVDPEGTTLYVVEWEPVPTVSAYALREPGNVERGQ